MPPSALATATETAAKVSTTTGVWNASASTLTAVCLLIGLVTAWVKFGPKWRELGIGERRNDLDDMKERIKELEGKVDALSATAHAAEMKTVYAVAACQLLAARIRADNPDDPTLRQATELLAAATGGEMPRWEDKLGMALAAKKTAT